jgi:hypothetical protein
MKRIQWTVILSSVLSVAACREKQESQSTGTPAASGATEEDVALSDVPEALKQAALAAVPGLVLEEAEKETEDGQVVYSLSGMAGGEEVEVELTSSGEVLEVERGE